MKILYIVAFYPEYGGPYSVVKELAKFLHKRGHTIGVYTTLPKGYDKSKLEKHSYIDDLVYLETDNIISRFWKTFSKQWKDLLPKMRAYDLIHIQGLYEYQTYFVYKYVKKPYIITTYGVGMKEDRIKKGLFKKTLFLLLIGKKILNNAKAVQALSIYEKTDLENIGINKELITTIPNGIDPNDFNDCPPRGSLFKKFPTLRAKKIVLFLGRITIRKNLQNLIPAFSYVITKLRNAHLVLVGPDTEGYMKKVNKWIRDYRLDDHVSYLGPLYGKDKLSILQESDMFVLPSYFEGFSVALLEAMYMGLPVVTTSKSGLTDIAVEHNAALSVTPTNRSEISSAVIKLLKNGILAHEMGENGRKLVKDKFMHDKVADRMINVYNDIVIKSKDFMK